MNLIFEVDEMLRIGLDWSGFDVSRQSTVNLDTNVRRFQSNFGSSPLVCSALWKDLVTTDIPEARIHPKTSATLDKFLLALYFLKGYPTEEKLAAHSKMCEKVARKWAWLFACKIQALKTKKIVWPERWTRIGEADEIFLYSVDGVHCRTNEAIHPTLAKNTKLFSHKFNQAGVGYELAVSLRENALVWMNGPFVASKHDVTIFRENGLKAKTPISKKGIAVRGYQGEKDILCTPNSQDTPELRKLKTRARARHETFNARIKNFACLDARFRHGISKHKICFEAVCVIVQYQLENGAPLFDL